MSTFDIIIVGGGHSGLTLTTLLAAQGVSVACIDRDDIPKTLSPSFDGRTVAISYGSQKIIARGGAWGLIPENALCPIEDIDITDGGSPVLLNFMVREMSAPAFGWIVENRILRHALYERVKTLKFATHITGAVVDDFAVGGKTASVTLKDGRVFSAALIVGADGRGSTTREFMGIGTRGWSYGQTALVGVMTHTKPHHNKALEDFRSQGPFALLPMTDDAQGRHRSSIVWSVHSNERDIKKLMPPSVFETAIQARTPECYGDIQVISGPSAYPLNIIHAHQYTAPRMALVADAAHGIHPIAGQGLNLGLRDIDAIADLIISAHQKDEDVGADQLLNQYQQSRRVDNMMMAGATDILNKLFSNPSKTLSLLRKVGLKAVQKISPARRFFMKQAMGMK